MTQAYLLLDTGQEKSGLRWPPHRPAGIKKEGGIGTRKSECGNTAIADQSLPSGNSSSYLGHLDHIGKLCQTGDGDHVMIGFHLVPGEVIKHSKPCHGIQHFSEAMWWERDDPVLTISTPPQPSLPSLHPRPLTGLNSPSVTKLWEWQRCWHSLQLYGSYDNTRAVAVCLSS